jgi:hypothetical protein
LIIDSNFDDVASEIDCRYHFVECAEGYKCNANGVCEFFCESDDECISEFGDGHRCNLLGACEEIVPCVDDNDCSEVDEKCINGVCEFFCGEDVDCKDKFGEGYGCADGVCGIVIKWTEEEGCPAGTMRCEDDTCRANCGISNYLDCNGDGICDEDESCNCPDCEGVQDSCEEGSVCDTNERVCLLDCCGPIINGAICEVGQLCIPLIDTDDDGVPDTPDFANLELETQFYTPEDVYGTDKCCPSEKEDVFYTCAEIGFDVEGNQITRVDGPCLNVNEEGIGTREVSVYKGIDSQTPQTIEEPCAVLPEDKKVPGFGLISLIISLSLIIGFYILFKKRKF